MSVQATQEVHPSPKSSTAQRRAQSGSAHHGPSGFAQMLQLAAEEEASTSPSATPAAADSDAGASQDAGNAASADAAPDEEDSKLPSKQALSAEDLALPAMPLREEAIAQGPGADKGRELLGKLGASKAGGNRPTAADLMRALSQQGDEGKSGTDAQATWTQTLGLATSVADAAVTVAAKEEQVLRPVSQLPVEPILTPATDPSASAARGAADLPPALPESAGALTHAHAHIEPPLGSDAFNQALGHQLQVWIQSEVQVAQLDISPKELGPIEVRIEMVEGRAEVALDAEHASTREVLQQALGHLQEALGEVGLQLGSGSGGAQAQTGGQPGEQGQTPPSLAQLARAMGRLEGDEPQTQAGLAGQSLRPRSLVDLVA